MHTATKFYLKCGDAGLLLLPNSRNSFSFAYLTALWTGVCGLVLGSSRSIKQLDMICCHWGHFRQISRERERERTCQGRVHWGCSDLFCTLSTHANLGQAGSKIKFFENARHLAGSNFRMPAKVRSCSCCCCCGPNHPCGRWPTAFNFDSERTI